MTSTDPTRPWATTPPPPPASPPPRARFERPHDRVVAGVAGALATELGIGRGWIRAAFVLLTFFGGAGLVLYVLGIFLIPNHDEDKSAAQRWFDSNDRVRSVGAIVLLLVAFVMLFGGWGFWDGRWFPGTWVLIIVGLLLLFGPRIDRNRGPEVQGAPLPPMPPPPAPTGAGPASGPAGGPAASGLAAGEAALTQQAARETAATVQAAGEAALTQQAAREAAATEQAAHLTAATEQAAGSTGADGADEGEPPPPRLFGPGPPPRQGDPEEDARRTAERVARSRRSLRAVGATLASVAILAAAGLLVAITAGALPLNWGWGERSYQPATVGDLKHYRLFAGEQHVDLSRLALGSSQRVTVHVDQRFGRVRIDVPENARIDFNTHVRSGENDALGRRSSGWDNGQPLESYTPPGWSAGPTIRLDVHLTAGSLSVERPPR